MKLTGDVEVQNRLLPTFNMRNVGKTSRCQLALGNKPGKKDEIQLMICSKQDRNGKMYRILQNVENIFGRFTGEGKATVRLSEPCVDICISRADPVQLRSFLSAVHQAAKGTSVNGVTMTTLAPMTSKQVDTLRTRLRICKRSDYPLTSGFPSSLNSLQINSCSLKRVDSRILTLRHLVSLDLSDNHLRSLPESWNGLEGLTHLSLANNQLENISTILSSSALQTSLQQLNVCNNAIGRLENRFHLFRNLISFRCDSNRLRRLPPSIGRLTQLRELTASHNLLEILPGEFSALRLDSVDLSENVFRRIDEYSPVEHLVFSTLLECSARAIINNRVHYKEEDVGHLTSYLAQAKTCLCGGVCFESFARFFRPLDLRTISASMTVHGPNGSTLPIECYVCSRHCYERYAV